jgi:hypothetical protein
LEVFFIASFSDTILKVRGSTNHYGRRWYVCIYSSRLVCVPLSILSRLSYTMVPESPWNRSIC